MEINFTEHALERMRKRNLNKDFVKNVIRFPDKIDKSEKIGNRFLAKKVYFNKKLDKDHLLMVVFEKDNKEKLNVITVIDTSKISKYL